MPSELRSVEVNSSSESEGIVLAGYAGDSGNCASSEGPQIHWSDEDEESVPLGVVVVVVV